MNIKQIIMNKKEHLLNELLFLTMFILLGIIGRTILVGWHIQPFPNFEIIMVLTFLATLFIRPTFAFLVPLISMVGSDLLIGNPIFIGNEMNKIVLFTYTGFLIITILSSQRQKQTKSRFQRFNTNTIVKTIGMGIGFVLFYDLWTNFGWWYLMFPHTLETLYIVYLSGIPFMIYHILSAVLTFTLIALPISYLVFNKTTQLQPKSNKIYEKIPLITITLLLLTLSFTGTAMQIPENTEIWIEETDETSIHFTIQGHTWKLQENICIKGRITVLQGLQIIAEQHDFNLESIYYESFDATLIQSIHMDTNGDHDKYWQFYVNGELPMVGCDKYVIENGDKVSWSFEIVPS